MESNLLSYNGERRDPVSGVYQLGNGYRSYNPALMRFHSPDSFSPFGAGGINPYAYCAGDPINRSDPSGHFSWQAGLGMGLGILGLLGAAFTAGGSLVAAGSLSAALESASLTTLISGASGMVADISGIASALTAKSDPSASSILGWASFASGMLSGVTALSTSQLANHLSHASSITKWSHEENFSPLFTTQYTLRSGGQNVKSVTYLFEDRYKGGLRVNFMAHGAVIEDGTAIILGPGRSEFTGDEFVNYLRQRHQFNFEAYDCARLIICDSANGGAGGFAARFARASGLPTKAYYGSIYTQNVTDQYVNLTEAENIGFGVQLNHQSLNQTLRNLQNRGETIFSVIKYDENRSYFPAYFNHHGQETWGIIIDR